MGTIGITAQVKSTFVLGLLPGTAVELRRESDNPYDKDAVSTWLGELKLGYLDSRSKLVVSRDMDKGIVLNARIHSTNVEGAKVHGRPCTIKLIIESKPKEVGVELIQCNRCKVEKPVGEMGRGKWQKPKKLCRACASELNKIAQQKVRSEKMTTPTEEYGGSRESAILWLCDELRKARKSEEESRSEIEKAYGLLHEVKRENTDLKGLSDSLREANHSLEDRIRVLEDDLAAAQTNIREIGLSAAEQRELVSLGYPRR